MPFGMREDSCFDNPSPELSHMGGIAIVVSIL
jgi:hypothetical protein